MAKKTEKIDESALEFREFLKALAITLDEYLNDIDMDAPPSADDERQFGFAVLVFPFDAAAHRVSFVSNAEPASLVQVLNDHIKHLEKHMAREGGSNVKPH